LFILVPDSDMSNQFTAAKFAFLNYSERFFIHSLSQNVELPTADAFVVIPCYAEEHLFKTLESLSACHQSESKFCILLVVNDKQTDSIEIKALSLQNLELCEKFKTKDDFFRFAWIDARNLIDKNAGVGLARKIGMDAVILNCASTGKNPAIICLDADCEVSPHYFQQLDTDFVLQDFDVATLGFDHHIPSGFDPDLERGIIQYELFLEYYRLGLKMAGFPFAFHTVGSSMACKANVYALQGGMNQRNAGEDFYFLHKLFPHYKTVEIVEPIVFPSPRISKRVPFGTGRFQEKWKESEDQTFCSYHPQVFNILKDFTSICLQSLQENKKEFMPDFDSLTARYPKADEFLSDFNVVKNLTQVYKSSPKVEQRKKAFFRWFDGLLALRFVHFFDSDFPEIPVFNAIKILDPELVLFHNPIELKYALRKRLQAFQSKSTL